jgi:hypothetical protein
MQASSVLRAPASARLGVTLLLPPLSCNLVQQLINSTHNFSLEVNMLYRDLFQFLGPAFTCLALAKRRRVRHTPCCARPLEPSHQPNPLTLVRVQQN